MRKPNAPASIGDAIRARRRLSFSYGGHPRVVEPHVHGVDATGHVALSAYQVRGGSQTDEPVGWKHFRLDDVRHLTVLDETFPDPRPGYNRADKTFMVVYSQL
ncbi:WYL domain-containing protein [Piscinibacter sp.]|uniref:WYL domain-containing protein n=1 Tax=Piscinibacter sp. TaxID=1903157 RepID=UPI002C409B5E|nr:WYL domain-containing protein [Albitalea sp.]HUG21448.1 WYL domain-containing protein [Albitalea sp.]